MTQHDSGALREEPRSHLAIIKSVITDPPAWLKWGWFGVTLWLSIFGFAVIAHSHTPLHIETFEMVAEINGYDEFGQLVESESGFGWGGFFVGLSFHLLYVIDHIRRALRGEA